MAACFFFAGYKGELAKLENGQLPNQAKIVEMCTGVLGIFSDWPATTTFYASQACAF